MNEQTKIVLYRYIIPTSLIVMTAVYPSVRSSPRPIIDWLIGIYFCCWLCAAFWQVPDPYKVRKNSWWKPVYVNRSEQSLKRAFLIQIGGFGIGLSAVVWLWASFFIQISFPFSPVIAIVYGLLFVLGMLPAYPKFKQAYSEETE